MAKEKKEVDIFIEDEISSGDKKAVKSKLKVPYIIDNKAKSLRIYSVAGGKTIFVSTRTGGLQINGDCYEMDVTGNNEIIGKRYELTECGSKLVLLTGKISQKKAGSNVIDFQKAANAGK